MIAQMELDIQRKLTTEFVRADETQLVLTRRTKVSDGAGGHTYTEAPLPAQGLRLIPQQDTAREVQAADGSMVHPRYVLLGRYTADMQRGDKFTYQGNRYEVGDVEDKQYEVKGDVIYLGRG